MIVEQFLRSSISRTARDITYQMAIKDVLTVEFGSRPASSTKSSNAQYSKLQSVVTNVRLNNIQTN
jgi:hypothetical protein